MRKTLYIISFLSLLQFYLSGQTLTQSHLPIVVLETEEDYIPDEPKMDAIMGIIDNGEGQINHIDDAWNGYNGRIGIETRGNSTQGFDKKTYSLELRDDQNEDQSVPLLNMAKEEDWILHAMVIDKSQLRIPMSFYLFQQMGHYASNWRYVELVWNGEYRGLYILTEKIKRDKARVDMPKLDEDDLAGDSLTGGYILRIDWLDDWQGFESNFESQSGDAMRYHWYYPRADRIKDEQKEYIKAFMDEFESAVFADDFYNNNGVRYTDYIDIQSFVDFILINEFSKNSDGYKLSTYLHKDNIKDGGLLNAGPIWDFDQTYGLSRVCSNDDPEGWTYTQTQDGCEDLQTMPLWWNAMMQDSIFTNLMSCRWSSFRERFLHQDSLFGWIDQQRDYIAPAIDRNFELWDYFIGESIWIEPDPIPQSYDEEISVLKSWITERLSWMDQNMPGVCDFNVISQDHHVDFLNIKIFPNPSKGKLQINLQDNINISIIDEQGRTCFQEKLLMGSYMLDLEHLVNGQYIIIAKQGDRTWTEQIVISK